MSSAKPALSGVKVATAQYPVSEPTSWEAFEAGLSRWVAEGAAGATQLLVFPEYAAMVLAALFDTAVRTDLSGQLRAMQELRENYLDLHRRLARLHGVHILAGSFPWHLDDGRFVNRAWLLAPDGSSAFQDKQVMTRFEREQWGISRGGPLRVFDTALGCLGVAICYDAEFPQLVRAQVEAGAELLLVPSCTDAHAGYQRVLVAARARALESQCPVVLSPLVGEARWSPAIDVNIGIAGIYGPPDRGFPDDGVIAQGRDGAPRWVRATLERAATAEARTHGQVLNVRHWPEAQPTALVDRIRIS
ncbi:MAG: carbon-nitrogen hydrolase family protein [Panacagrimonas sp.]